MFNRELNYNDEGFAEVVNEAENAGRNKTLLIKNSGATVANVTVYTVPAGKVAFITSAWISGRSTSTSGTSGATLRCVISAANLEIIGIIHGIGVAGQVLPHEANAITFANPIKLEAGDTVVIPGGTNVARDAGFVGWEENA